MNIVSIWNAARSKAAARSYEGGLLKVLGYSRVAVTRLAYSL